MKLESKFKLDYLVKNTDLASSLSLDEEDDFPEVFSTSRMIAIMELAAARLMKPLLAEGELSVGVNVNVNHLAATPNNQEVQAVAIYKGMEGKLYKFEVEVNDKGGKAGHGFHTRAIVGTDRLLRGALTRVEAVED